VASGGSVASGSEVTLTASVMSGTTALTVGQVNFCNAAFPYCTDVHLLGTAQLTSAGTAVLRFHPGIGSHSYNAVFAGTPNGVLSAAASTSIIITLTVTGTLPTTTAIAASGSAGNYSLTATVTGFVNTSSIAAPAGVVSFLDTTTNNVVPATPSLGNAVFAPVLAYVSNPQTGNEPKAIVTGDFNGDGNLDLAAGVNDTSQSVSILLGDGTGNFTAMTKSLITATGSPVLVQDFNGDGIPDLLLSNYPIGPSAMTILLGNGDGTFKVAPGSPFFTNYGTYPVVSADFNGDGIPDLAIAGGYYLTIWLGNGDGSFTEVPIGSSSITEASLFGSMVEGDFNGDGIPDIAVLDLYDQTVSIFLGNGDGTFTTGSPITISTISAGSPTSLTIGDFNGDGKLDLAVPLYGSSGSLAILLGNGDGTFYSASGSPVPVEDFSNSVAVGDFNGDGIADLLVAARTSGQTLNILLGKGDGTFSQMPTGSAQLPCCSNAALGDFNGDGVTDIASSSFYYSAEVLLTQLTQTTTATASGISVAGTGIHQVEASYPGNSTYSSSVSATTGLAARQVTPLVTVTPASSNITTVQTLSLTITVTAASSDPAPTGSVTLTSGGYSSVPTGLINGSATISIPAGSLAAGSPTVTASYSGDTNYFAITGIASVKVTALQSTPTVTPSLPNITTAQALSVTIAVPAASTGPIPSGTVTLTSASYGSAATSLIGGSATISIPAGSLAIGADTLTASYSGDAIYSAATSTTQVMVASPTFSITGTTASVAPGATTGNTSTITVTPYGNFTGSVTLTAAITSSPAGAQYPPTLSFGTTSPVSITGTTAGTATLTISTTAATSSALVYSQKAGVPWYAAGGATLACILFFGIPARRRSWRTMFGMLALLITLACGMTACGGGGSGGSSGGSSSTPGTTAGAYTVTVSATSGTITEMGTVTLTVQ
jgi:hypothetical protein